MARFSFFILLLLVPLSFGQNYPDKKIDAYIREIIDLTANEEFEKAEKTSQIFKTEFPANPFPYLLSAANYINWKHSEKSVKFNDVISSNLATADKISDSLISVGDGNIWNYYAKALSSGYLAYFEGLLGDYFSAFGDASTAIDYYEKCLEIDSTFTDAIIAIAIYDYWISEKFGWIPFVKDNRKSAIMKLFATLDKDSYNNKLGSVSLFWIMMNEERYDEAKKIIVRETEKYPRNRYLLMAYANVEKRFETKKAIEIYKRALDLTLSKKRENRINEIILRHKIAMLEFNLKNYDNVLEQCNIALSYNLSDYEKEALDERLEKIKKLYESAKKRKYR